MITVQVVYAEPNKSTIIECKINEQISIIQAIEKSGIILKCQLTLSNHTVGIYGKLCDLADLVEDGDRIEIYRALINDPKEIRRRRAAQRTSSHNNNIKEI